MSPSRYLLSLSVLTLGVGAACSRTPPAAEPAPAPTPAPTPAEKPAPTAPAPSGGSSVRRDTLGSVAVREFRGAYTQGWEASWFEPCDAPIDDRLWWVTLSDKALHQRDSLLKTLKTRPTGALAVRWRGSTSGRMPAGMMGHGTRYLLVTEVVEVRALPSEGACLPGTRTS